MFSNRRVEKFDDRAPEFLQDLAENPQGAADSAARSARRTHEGKPVPKMKAYNVRDAIFEAMLHRFAIDPTMVAFGEENRDWGGAFAVYRGLDRSAALPPPVQLADLGSRPSWAPPSAMRWRAAGWWPN